MRDALIQAEQAREALHAPVLAWLETLEMPRQAAHLRPLVVVQAHPLLVRLFLVSPTSGRFAEVARETAFPGVAELEGAVEAFLAAGVGAMPGDTGAAALQHATRAGWGFVVLLDPLTGSARAALAPGNVGAHRWIEIFSIMREGEETTH
jgi:hypothetical protein